MRAFSVSRTYLAGCVKKACPEISRNFFATKVTIINITKRF